MGDLGFEIKGNNKKEAYILLNYILDGIDRPVMSTEQFYFVDQ